MTGADRDTIEVYNRLASEWVDDRTVQDEDHVAWVQANRADGPVVDIGCGPGWHLPAVEPAIGLDASSSMLALAEQRCPGTPKLLASAGDLPFSYASLGGALANRVYLHLRSTAVPMALADLHRALAPDAPAFVRVIGGEMGTDFRATGDFAGRLFSGWSQAAFTDLCHGAGLMIDTVEIDGATDRLPTRFGFRLRRSFTLADTVGADMRLLLCGLNPSPYSAEVGIGFGRPGNRFWPAALEAGLVSRDRDPRHALTAHRIGMTDIVKRPTRTAAELDVDEYRAGLDRVRRLVDWLRPNAICFVGLAGWRAAMDRKAVAGLQPEPLGSTPVYVMPSTSGLNAHSQLPDLAEHLRAALALADEHGR